MTLKVCYCCETPVQTCTCLLLNIDSAGRRTGRTRYTPTRTTLPCTSRSPPTGATRNHAQPHLWLGGHCNAVQCKQQWTLCKTKPVPWLRWLCTWQQGFGLAFTLGRGNEIVCHCVDSLRFLLLGQQLASIFSDMGAWLYKVNNEGQLRWLGPEKVT